MDMSSLAIETSLDGIVIGDPEGYITYANKAIAKMFDYENREELVGRHVLEFIIEPERPQALEKSLESIRTGQAWAGKFTCVASSGRIFPVEITATPLKDESGATIGFIDVVRDITEHIKNEKKLKEANRKLEVANEKLLVVGGIVRHDIANKLNILNCSSYLAKKKGKTDDVFDAVKTASDQINRTLNFSRDYERIGEQELTHINVGQTFDEVTCLFLNVTNIEIQNQCCNLTVLADSLLKELFYNLVDNTLKYGEKTSKIKLSHVESAEGLELVYEDDGFGIPEDMKQHLFKKGFGKGTGLGLFLAKKISEVYGWQIREEGQSKVGAKFVITIPKTVENRVNYISQ